MVALIFILSYFVLGSITSRILLPSLWARSETVPLGGDGFNTRQGYVNCIAVFNFLFWPILFPIHLLLGSSHRLNPDTSIAQLKKKELEVKQMRRDINLLEKANNMELSDWNNN